MLFELLDKDSEEDNTLYDEILEEEWTFSTEWCWFWFCNEEIKNE